MKQFITLLLFSCICRQGIAQTSFGCISHEVYQKHLQNDAQFKKNQDQLEAETQLYMSHLSANRTTSASPYIIPMVFHIVYSNSHGNIDDSQIIDQMGILNQEFKRHQADTALTPAAFKAVAAPFNVEFRLATKDPNGKCTNGITRTYSSLSDCSLGEDDVKALVDWPSDKYLNVWLVQSMHYAGLTDCNGGGYGTFPGGAADVDGVNIHSDLIGTIGTAPGSAWGNFYGRYLVHELGHWFNLHHIWGDAYCGNDFISDTPPSYTSNSGCPTFPHNPNSTCAGSGPDGEMFSDYMDYSTGSCLNMFTAGQVARMTAAINSTVSGRSNLWTAANLSLTGTSDPYSYPSACAIAIPDVTTYTPVIACVGDSIAITDNSYGGGSTSRLWNFNNGNSSSLTNSLVNVSYSSPGVYSFDLTENFQGSSNTTNFLNKIYVMDHVPDANYVVPFSDSLEDPYHYDSWTIVNEDNDLTTWDFTSNTSFSGQSCIGIENFSNIAPAIDDLISPAYDLTAVTNATLTFRIHFSQTTSLNYDKLIVSISNNCEKTWSQLYLKTSNLKTTNTLHTTNYYPDVESNEWRLERVIVPNVKASAIVRFKFSFTSGGGNNLFIDDINVGGLNATGIQSYGILSHVSMFPNPASDAVTVDFNINNNGPIQAEVIDVVGKVCLVQQSNQITTGENKIKLNTSSLKDGVYLIRLKQNNVAIYNSKFIKQSTN